MLCGGRGKARSNDFRRGQATGYNFGKFEICYIPFPALISLAVNF